MAIVMPRDIESSWVAIENVLQKGAHKENLSSRYAIDDEIESLEKELGEEIL